MRTLLTATALFPVTVVAAALLADAVNFDNLPVGRAPAGWTATRTGTGDAIWTVEKDATAPSQPNVLKQSGQATYPVCIKDDTNLKDGFVEVKFKPISGREDQAGGVVWRAKDPDNYYVARANALEDNVTIYHTINGRRTEKKRANVRVASKPVAHAARGIPGRALHRDVRRQKGAGVGRRDVQGCRKGWRLDEGR